MIFKSFKYFLFLFVSLTHCLSSNAQVFQQYSTHKDAPVTSVLGITKDKKGFMWFATSKGLFRFDSQSFKKYNTEDPRSNYIDDVYCDSDGRLWISTWSGVSLYNSNTDTFQYFIHDSLNVNSPSGNRIHFIVEDSQKRLWMGTDKSLDEIRKENGTYKFIRNTSISGEILCLVEGKNGERWAGSSDGIIRLADDRTKLKTYKVPSVKTRPSINYIETILVDNKGNLWLGSASGLVHFDTQKETFEIIEDFKNLKYPVPSIKKIIQDKKDKFWIATESGLAYFNPENGQSEWFVTEPGNPHSLSDDILYSMYMDNQGGLWLGSYYLGISYLNTNSPEIKIWPSYSKTFTSGWLGNTPDKKCGL